MTAPGKAETADTSLTRDVLYAVRYYLGGRRGLLILGGVALAGGLAFNWSWLVAVGIAPLLIAALPCVAMCALGFCMNRTSGQSCSTDAAPEKTIAPRTEGLPTGVRAAPADTSPARPANAPADDLAAATVPTSEP